MLEEVPDHLSEDLTSFATGCFGRDLDFHVLLLQIPILDKHHSAQLHIQCLGLRLFVNSCGRPPWLPFDRPRGIASSESNVAGGAKRAICYR